MPCPVLSVNTGYIKSLLANAKVPTFLGSIQASFEIVESEGGIMKHC
jgi:hypothetical protein